LWWRILALPLIAFVVAGFVPGHEVTLALVCGGLLAGQLVLLALLLRPGTEPPLRSPVLVALDLACAAGLHLWLATIVPAGGIAAPNSDNSWTYVMATAAFWLAARGVATGAAVLVGAVALDAAAIAVNGASGVVSVHHVVLLLVASGASALFIRWSRHGIEVAAAGSRHAGQQAERLEVMQRLVDRGRAAWVAIKETATSAGDAQERLHAVRGLALGAAAELRAAVSSDSPRAPSLLAGLSDLADHTRRWGTRVELVAAELDGDPPPQVVDAVIRAVAVALETPATDTGGRSVVLHACGGPHRVEVTVRSRGPGPPPAGGPIAAEIVRAIRAVAAGSTYVTPTLAGLLLRHPTPVPLTPREIQVLQLVARGERDADIAGELFISRYTVRSHLDRIRGKLGAASRVDLARYAIDRGPAPPTMREG
jgi:DNA-binding CsgD family transcriptional regulator